MLQRSRTAHLLGLLAGIALGVAGCGGNGGDGESASLISLELAEDPVVGYDAANARTTIEVQFVPRGVDGVPLAPADVTVDMLIDGTSVSKNPLNESVVVESSEALSASLLYSLVLDASSSMVQQQPEAFGPMKQAAQASVEDGLSLWSGRPSGSVFLWDLCWFNEYLFAPEGEWVPDFIFEIPPPEGPAPTKLYAAVEFMAKKMLDTYNAGQAAGVRDHHVMVVLSDGVDNVSSADNSSFPPQTRQIAGPRGTATYRQFGWESTSLQKAVAAIKSHPKLTVHALALGTDFGGRNEGVSDLRAIASAGGGQFLQNPSSTGVTALFDRVTKEFSTLQMRRLSVPQPDGDHSFRLVVRPRSGLGEAGTEFHYRSGPSAQLLLPPSAR